MIPQIFNPTVELATLTGTATNEVIADFEIQPVTVEAQINMHLT